MKTVEEWEKTWEYTGYVTACVGSVIGFVDLILYMLGFWR